MGLSIGTSYVISFTCLEVLLLLLLGAFSFAGCAAGRVVGYQVRSGMEGGASFVFIVAAKETAEAAIGLQPNGATAQHSDGFADVAASNRKHRRTELGGVSVCAAVARELAGAAVGLMLRWLPSEIPQHALHGAFLDDVLVIFWSGVLSGSCR